MEEKIKKSNKILITVLIVTVVVIVVATAVALAIYFIQNKKPNNSNDINEPVSSDTELNESEENKSEPSSNLDYEISDNINDKQSQQTSTVTPSISSNSSEDVQIKRSASPNVTVTTQVANGVCVVGGLCSKETEYITVSGKNVTTEKIYPFEGKDNNYFLSQVLYCGDTELEFTATERGLEVSHPIKRTVSATNIAKNYMEMGEYSPYIGKNCQMHFYSALLSYSLTVNKLSEQMRAVSAANISYITEAARSVGAEPIFLIIPSSAEIYPETVPDNYKKSGGEGLYQAFSKIAAECGAKVFYPIDTMKKHRNDGSGYRIYPHTDSHWTSYGAYWGTYDMMNYISQSYPLAAPRKFGEMGFYITEMYGGDALFNFPKNIGFENQSAGGRAMVTGIRELVPLYTLRMPTSTLSKVYNSNTGLYLTQDNAAASTVNNPNGAGLPSALIMRDSFGKVCYDMISDRFSTVYWEKFGNYNLPIDKINSYRPNYVIYIFSERNLLKIMLNDSNATVLNLK